MGCHLDGPVIYNCIIALWFIRLLSWASEILTCACIGAALVFKMPSLTPVSVTSTHPWSAFSQIIMRIVMHIWELILENKTGIKQPDCQQATIKQNHDIWRISTNKTDTDFNILIIWWVVTFWNTNMSSVLLTQDNHNTHLFFHLSIHLCLSIYLYTHIFIYMLSLHKPFSKTILWFAHLYNSM